jgi:choline dehydrogenase
MVRSDKRLERPDLQINMFAWAIKDGTATAWSPALLRLRPLAGASAARRPRHGAAEIADPLAAPEIRFNFLKTPTTGTPC